MKSSKLVLIMMLTSLGGLAQTQQFTNVGNNNFVAPEGVLSVKVQAIGGGGGGGRVKGSSARESGGGGGAAYASGIVNVTAGETYIVHVGNAGVQNSSTAIHGGSSYFGSASSTDALTTVRAEGGKTLILSDGSQSSGAQGGKAANSVGNLARYNGGNGGSTNDNDYGGGGGGAAGSNGPGQNGGEGTPGIGTSNYGGSGGNGGVSGGDDDGVEGYNYGGGGGGARKSWSGVESNRYGASGAQGIVVVSWLTISSFTPDFVCSNSTAPVVITGTNFVDIDSVSVNGITVPFSVVNDTEITLSELDNATSGSIIVYGANGSAQSLEQLQVSNNTVSINQQGVTLTAQYSGAIGNASFQWIDCVSGNSPVSGAIYESFTATHNSLYSVQVTENGCTVSSDCVAVGSVGLYEEEMNNSWNVFPNPAENMITIEYNTLTPSSISIKDLSGKEVKANIAPVSGKTNVDLSGIRSGVYFVEIISESGRSSKKLIIK